MFETALTEEKRDALECETDMMTALSRLFGEAYLRGRVQGRNDHRREEIRNGPGQTPEPCGKPYPTEDAGMPGMRCCRRKGHGPPHADCIGGDGFECVDPEHQHERRRRHARAILSELASMPCELPTVEDIQHAADSGITLPFHRRIEVIVRSRIAPILAAKNARIAQLEEAYAVLRAFGNGADRIRELELRLETIGEWPGVKEAPQKVRRELNTVASFDHKNDAGEMHYAIHLDQAFAVIDAEIANIEGAKP